MPDAPSPRPLVPAGGFFDGLVEVRGPARIDGEVIGDVYVEDALWVGAEARVSARIRARAVVVEGQVDGEIHAPDKVELRPSARARASLHTARFVLSEGAVFEGRCETLPPPAGPEGARSGTRPDPISNPGTS